MHTTHTTRTRRWRLLRLVTIDTSALDFGLTMEDVIADLEGPYVGNSRADR